MAPPPAAPVVTTNIPGPSGTQPAQPTGVRHRPGPLDHIYKDSDDWSGSDEEDDRLVNPDETDPDLTLTWHIRMGNKHEADGNVIEFSTAKAKRDLNQLAFHRASQEYHK